MIFELLAGRRRVKVTDRRTKVDFAQVIREIAEEDYPDVETIVLVMVGLSAPGSLRN